jgi:glycine oxidase
MQKRTITVVGAGITGLWQALLQVRRGHAVRLVEKSPDPFVDGASVYAGAMLGPFCETEHYAPVIRDLGLKSIGLWRDAFPGTILNGTLVVAAARDRSEIDHFSRLTEGHERVSEAAIAALEPDLEGRFTDGLFFAQEGHVAPRAAMGFLLDELKRSGVELVFGQEWTGPASADDIVIDCRGLGARDQLTDLRGVRGERVIVRTREVTFRRPVRLLHPRHSLYVVPWDDGLFMVGATVIESDDAGPITVRSALELLSKLYALHPAFGEAEIVEATAGVRPAFADNVPKVIVRRQTIFVNGLYRHGFLLAPALAELVDGYLQTGAVDNRVFVVQPGA